MRLYCSNRTIVVDGLGKIRAPIERHISYILFLILFCKFLEDELAFVLFIYQSIPVLNAILSFCP